MLCCTDREAPGSKFVNLGCINKKMTKEEHPMNPLPKNTYLIMMVGNMCPVILGAVLSGSIAPGKVSQGKLVPVEGPQ